MLQWGCGMEPQKTAEHDSIIEPASMLQWGCGMEPQKTARTKQRWKRW